MKCNLSVNALSVLVASGLLFGAASCTHTEKDKTDTTTTTTTTTSSTEGDEAYNNYKTYVEDADRDTAYVYENNRDWNKEITDRESAYNERLANVDKYASNYDEARRAEIEKMKTRYNTNWENRKNTYSTYAKGTTWRPVYLTVPENATDLNALTPANIRAAYENFVAKVEANKKSYSNADWQIVEGMWNDLDARKNAIQNELSGKDKYEIGKAKAKYIAMKAASKTGNTAENVGSDIKDATKSGASKVGNTAENVGSDVKEGTKEGASKVGNAAKKVGNAVKETYKKAEDKVDGTKNGK